MLTGAQVTPTEMHFRNKVSPYENKTLKGRVLETWLRGSKIYSLREGLDSKGPQGVMLLNRQRAN